MTKLAKSWLLCLALAIPMLPVAVSSGQDPSPDLDASQNPDLFSESFGGEEMDFDFDTEEFDGFGGDDFVVQEVDPEALAATWAAMVGGIVCISAFFLILTGIVAFLMSDALNAVPEQFRELNPLVPWLLFVPIVGIVVLFLVLIKVPRSLSNYLAANGDNALGDCGEKTGLWGAVLYIIGCTFPIGLVMIVMAVLKINQAKAAARALNA